MRFLCVDLGGLGGSQVWVVDGETLGNFRISGTPEKRKGDDFMYPLYRFGWFGALGGLGGRCGNVGGLSHIWDT